MAENQYAVDFDPGTSSHAFLVDDLCKAAALAPRPFKQVSLQPGCVELYPLEIRSSRRVVRRKSSSINKHREPDIAAVCMTNQHKTSIYLNRSTADQYVDGTPAWQDRRTADFCKPFNGDRHAPEIEAKIGKGSDPYCSVSKLNSLQENGGKVRQDAEQGRFRLVPRSWRIWIPNWR
jgi:glycerol kinase